MVVIVCKCPHGFTLSAGHILLPQHSYTPSATTIHTPIMIANSTGERVLLNGKITLKKSTYFKVIIPRPLFYRLRLFSSTGKGMKKKTYEERSPLTCHPRKKIKQ